MSSRVSLPVDQSEQDLNENVAHLNVATIKPIRSECSKRKVLGSVLLYALLCIHESCLRGPQDVTCTEKTLE